METVLRMGEAVELQNIGISDRHIAEEESAYEILDTNENEGNLYTRIDYIVPNITQTTQQEGVNNEESTKGISSTNEPTGVYKTDRRLMLVCIVLAALVVVTAVSCGILINAMVRLNIKSSTCYNHLKLVIVTFIDK